MPMKREISCMDYPVPLKFGFCKNIWTWQSTQNRISVNKTVPRWFHTLPEIQLDVIWLGIGWETSGAKLVDISIQQSGKKFMPLINRTSLLWIKKKLQPLPDGLLPQSKILLFLYYSSSVGRMIKSATRDFNTPFELKELEDFYEQHKNELGTAKRGTLNSIEKVRANVQWMENYYTDIVSWLQNNV